MRGLEEGMESNRAPRGAEEETGTKLEAGEEPAEDLK